MKKYQYYFAPNKNQQKENHTNSNIETIYEETKHHIKSTSSTNQQTNHRASIDNIYAHKLESIILDLQREADQQQFQIQSLTEQSTMFMKTCEDQKQTINNLNVEALKNQYEQQIKQMTSQRYKIQEMISQLRSDYEQAFCSQQTQLLKIKMENQDISRLVNEQLDKKKELLLLIKKKQQIIHELNQEVNDNSEEMEELRNIERKLNIALREAELLQSNYQC